MQGRPGGFRRIGDDAVRAKTGKCWEEWFAILDDCWARRYGHTACAKYLRDEHGLAPWWAQAVTIRYEWERRLRGPSVDALEL